MHSYLNIHIYVCVCVYMCVYVYMYVYIHTYIHIYIFYIHTQRWKIFQCFWFYLYFGISLICRIGQKKDVRIYRLITRNTYEQHLFQCSSRKYGLDEAILGSMQEINHGSEYNENIENLLKKGAYCLLKVYTI